MERPKAIVFDLDETLTASKQPLNPEMGVRIEKLISRLPVGIISGATYERMCDQVLPYVHSEAYSGLFLMPTSGAALFFYNTNWRALYNNRIDEKEAANIIALVQKVVKQSGCVEGWQTWGPHIEFRGSQITFSALGQQAPYEKKVTWDPDKSKRRHLCSVLAPKLPAYDISLGGTTSIDIVLKGINKAYGVRAFAEYISCPIQDIIYVGDDLQPHGNDYVVKETGVATYEVAHPGDTEKYIDKLLHTLGW